MGTAHGAEELGLCPHGLACQAGAWGRYLGLCLGYGHIWRGKRKKAWQKYSARLITVEHDEILTNRFLHVKGGTLQMRIAVSRASIAQRARELLAHTYRPNLDQNTFSISRAKFSTELTSTRVRLLSLTTGFWV